MSSSGRSPATCSRPPSWWAGTSAERGWPAEPPRRPLEGRPGSGKTTAVARLVELLRRERFAVAGFLTRELRERGAHVGGRAGPRVGRYGVSHDELERLAIPALGADADVVVVDELGAFALKSSGAEAICGARQRAARPIR